MEVINDNVVNYDQMLIIERYEALVDYLYPIIQSMPRKHGIARDMFLTALFKQPELFYEAGKSNQSSKLYIADAGLALLRFWLRFLTNPKIKGMTINQHKVSMVLIAEVGSILGSWIAKRKG